MSRCFSRPCRCSIHLPCRRRPTRRCRDPCGGRRHWAERARRLAQEDIRALKEELKAVQRQLEQLAATRKADPSLRLTLART